jgi:hypothetical protein
MEAVSLVLKFPTWEFFSSSKPPTFILACSTVTSVVLKPANVAQSLRSAATQTTTTVPPGIVVQQ